MTHNKQEGNKKTTRTPFDFEEFSALGKRPYELEVIEEREEQKNCSEGWTLGEEEKQPQTVKPTEEEKGYYENLKEATGRRPFEFSFMKA